MSLFGKFIVKVGVKFVFLDGAKQETTKLEWAAKLQNKAGNAKIQTKTMKMKQEQSLVSIAMELLFRFF